MNPNSFQQQQQRQQQEMLQRQQQQFQQFTQHAQQEHQRMAQDFQRTQRMHRSTNTLDPTAARTLRRGVVLIFVVFAALFLIVLAGVIVIFTLVLSHFPH
jgi:preprotein translocase subunit SecF